MGALAIAEQKTLGLNRARVTTFAHVARQKRVSITVAEELRSRTKLEFSIDLARMLGLRAGVKYGQVNGLLGKTLFDLSSNLDLIYVYCDLVESMLVGDTKAPLLRIVDKSEKTTGVAYRTFNPIQFVPVQKKSFDTIEVKLAIDTGNVVPFFPGKCVLVLEFRRKAHDYFAI